MAYTDATAVHARNTGRPYFGASTKPTASDVAGYIEQTAAELDAILDGRGYPTPIPSTATVAWTLMRLYNTHGAACLVEQSAQASDRRDQACALWREAKAALADLNLPGVDLDTAQALPRYAASASPNYSLASTIW